jgi:hypothetical protein
MNKDIYLGNGKVNFPVGTSDLTEVNINNETYYKISNVDRMRPFFMSIVSNSNHWMFISSNGGLSAGRTNSNNALFPYYTDDKITESVDNTGSKTLVIASKEGKTYLWEPFAERQSGLYAIERNLYKNEFGNKVIFEEINNDLGLCFSYEWNSSNEFGFIRNAQLTNTSSEVTQIKLIDGLQNILPYGVGEDLQKASSNLVDAYKKSELHTASGIGIYSLSAIIVDRAEPSEALKTNLVWSSGLKNTTHLLSSKQLDKFRQGATIKEELEMKAERGAYLVSSSFELNGNSTEKWRIIAEVNKSITDLVALEESLRTADINALIDQDIEAGTQELLQLVGAADGLQLSEDKRGNVRHFANTMFNIMRGGIFDDNYTIEKGDFLTYFEKANKQVFEQKLDVLSSLQERFKLNDLIALADTDKNVDFSRLCYEYLPLKFSRRHGDPSRPWNKFSINTKDEIDGSKILDYQGNWRDIFQNWEALAHAYPAFIQGMMHKFLNASTFDGYNPYRVTKDGFDWETIEPNNPWAYIGYWGDHQVIYLLKFLEFTEKHYPGKLAGIFTQECFVYANVPYRIKPYKAILKDPKNTIAYDYANEEKIETRKKTLGADGALLASATDAVYKVNFVEKILAVLLAKLSNFVPEAGIWMNTQRPEWNDANNALVGNGVSMVTLYYLRRFLSFFKATLATTSTTSFALSSEMHRFFEALHKAFEQHSSLIEVSISDEARKTLMDALGQAASYYREGIYSNGFSGEKKTLDKDELLAFVDTTLRFMDDSIQKNRREDGLYHAYNLISIDSETAVSVDYLAEMLEGQVAVLSSGYLSGDESLAVLDALRDSKLYRADQQSYILYPNKDLGTFATKNNIPTNAVEGSELLKALVEKNNQQILSKDIKGDYHFNGNFKNADDLAAAIGQLPNAFAELVEKETQLLLTIFEEVFNHKAFTGRSGTFFGYEGLGSIYWHMVSKLAVAAFEVTKAAQGSSTFSALSNHYYEIVAGIGAHKTPEAYGAFPSDPYSHTPGGKGAQQPGMTGQVKEDLLSRFGELGVTISKGAIHFNPSLLKKEEFLSSGKDFHFYSVLGEKKNIALDKGSLAFTYCQVPVLYKKGATSSINISFTNEEALTIKGSSLTPEISKQLFNRTNEVQQIEVTLAEK